jgi:hypothetical protein
LLADLELLGALRFLLHDDRARGDAITVAKRPELEV